MENLYNSRLKHTMETWQGKDSATVYTKIPKSMDHSSSVVKCVIDRLEQLRKNEKSVKEYGLLLDVGCGNGASIRDFLPYFRRAVGIDINKYQVDIAKQMTRSDKTSFYVKKGDLFPVEDSSVDLIICAEAAHYMDMKAFVREVPPQN
uniref:probable S-adenosylmethionine-dependent methyltransferase CRG1 n=1 Tax=Styela clava TaxID=7725 RepID=UPI00193ACF60|nr:probable S-adenosylmethionine-dependent methyltransferase CRG1 [Styela clava]